MTLVNKRIEQCVELLCNKGCRSVWCSIDALQQGESLPETEGLNREEISLLLQELTSIMSVYEGSCTPE
jgi:hypothetical protein